MVQQIISDEDDICSNYEEKKKKYPCAAITFIL